jgi:hypothetical protein
MMCVELGSEHVKLVARLPAPHPEHVKLLAILCFGVSRVFLCCGIRAEKLTILFPRIKIEKMFIMINFFYSICFLTKSRQFNCS